MPRGIRKSKDEKKNNVSNAETTKTTRNHAETNLVIKETGKLTEPEMKNVQNLETENNDTQTMQKNKKIEIAKEKQLKTHRSKKTGTTKKLTKEEQLLDDIIIQYGGKEISALKIVKKVKQDCKDKGYRKQIRRVSIYVKPEDGKAYYALEDNSDSVNLFTETYENNSVK